MSIYISSVTEYGRTDPYDTRSFPDGRLVILAHPHTEAIPDLRILHIGLQGIKYLPGLRENALRLPTVPNPCWWRR